MSLQLECKEEPNSVQNLPFSDNSSDEESIESHTSRGNQLILMSANEADDLEFGERRSRLNSLNSYNNFESRNFNRFGVS